MSHKSRQKRRIKKAAIKRNKARNVEDTHTRYFLTIVSRQTRCSACGKHLLERGEFVYRKSGTVCLCVACADRDPLVSYRPSLRWESARRGSRSSR